MRAFYPILYLIIGTALQFSYWRYIVDAFSLFSPSPSPVSMLLLLLFDFNLIMGVWIILKCFGICCYCCCCWCYVLVFMLLLLLLLFYFSCRLFPSPHCQFCCWGGVFSPDGVITANHPSLITHAHNICKNKSYCVIVIFCCLFPN